MTRLLFYCKCRVRFELSLALWVLILLLASCNRGGQPINRQVTKTTTAGLTSPGVAETSLPPSPVPASSTPLPLAARVGKQEISMADYQAELALYRAAKGTDLAPEDKQRVLDDLIDQALLAQAAFEQGFRADDALLNERIQRLQNQLGSEGALNDWMKTYGYDTVAFRQALTRAVASAWMRDQIAASTPRTAEQIHARQILLYNTDQANEVYNLLKAGNDFGNLAVKYDPVTQGDLGWFPRGYLPDRRLEEAAFALQPEQFSPVIQTSAGYHILQVLERDAQHPLSPDALLIFQSQTLQAWLENQRTQAQIEVLLP
jgi:peptidyl-prolyl cis-trans isomerase C